MNLIGDLEQHGFAGPLPLFSAGQCADLLKALNEAKRGKDVWAKARATRSLPFYDLATDPRIIDALKAALGEDLVLWGASLVVKHGADVHPFHTDIESMDPAGGFVTVWMGLNNTTRESGLKFIPGSHRYGLTMQEANHRAGVTRAGSSDETALAAARQHDPAARIVQPDIGLGEAMFLDGRVWHGSQNASDATRTAVLLQYARADRPVFIPAGFEYPLEVRTDQRPPVLLLSGRAPIGVNLLARTPHPDAPNRAFEMLRAPASVSFNFASLPHFRGATPGLAQMDAHSSILAPGQSPHPLHKHRDEEILVVVDGVAELSTAGDGEGNGLVRTPMGPGDFAYYPAGQWHTLTNTGNSPVLYTMFKWIGQEERTAPSGDDLLFVKAGALLGETPTDKVNRGNVLDLNSRWLDRLHAHVSIMAGGGGYDAHADAYDVAIMLLEGAVETLGRTVRAPAVIFHPANAPHGLRAAGEDAARYLVFEFHRKPGALPVAVPAAKPNTKSTTKRPRTPLQRIKLRIKRLASLLFPNFAARRGWTSPR